MAPQNPDRLLCIANATELFDSAPSERPQRIAYGQAYRATLWTNGTQEYGLLCQDAPVLPVHRPPAWAPPSAVFETGNGISASLAPTTSPALREAFLEWLRPAKTLAVVSTVKSDGVASLAEWLRSARPDLALTGIPDTPAGLVRRFNTKRGGHELALEAGIAASDMPAQTLFGSIDASLRWLSRSAGDRRYILKPNAACGGFGIVLVRGGHPISERDLLPLRGRQQRGATWKSVAATSDGVVVETMVGSVNTNLSVTADFNISPNSGTITCLGMAEQILRGRTAYAGFRSYPDMLRPGIRERISGFGQLLGHRLFTYGYHGAFNIDVVVTERGKGSPHLIEINLRRSAPLDQFLLLTRIHGPKWFQRVHVDVLEGQVIQSRLGSIHDVEAMLSDRRVLARHGHGVLPLWVGHAEDALRLSIQVVSTTAGQHMHHRQVVQELLRNV